MDAGNIMEYLKGWGFLLSGLWGFILFPFAVSFVCQKKTRKLGVLSLTAVGLFVALLTHDVVVYRQDKRPVVPFYEWIFTIFIPHGGPPSVLLDVPLSNCTTNISHYWRGDYGVTVWVPNRMWDISEEDYICLDRGIQISGSFKRANTQSVDFISQTNQSKKGEWSPKGGGSTIHYEYNVPKDLPLDEVLTVDVHVSGNLQTFMTRFPDARLRVEKLCVK